MPELTKSLGAAMNEQIAHELSSAYFYLHTSTQCAAHNLKGAAHWLRKQWEEELGHALKLLDYVTERGGSVKLRSIEQPVFEYRSLTDVFEKVLAHEREITGAIYALCEKAAEDKDHASRTFLQWFVTEQVEEENSAKEILDTLRIAGDQGTALLMVDRQLARRGA